MSDDLKIIKKKYGEKMSQFCRDYFSTILERNGLLSNILISHFAESHELYNDLLENNLLSEFKNYIYNLKVIQKQYIKTTMTPKELLNEAGYDFYECHTNEDIEKFKKYYAKGEELCTFRGNRLDYCHVFFAVKKNVDEIKREDFKCPERQDLYGTSVISIQFTKDKFNTLSIKNRYNHRVVNPDATFSNNLDNITPGLNDSFEYHYNLSQKIKNDDFEIPNYVRANDGKYYKYNIEIDNIYYCPNNIIIKHFNVEKLPKERYVVFDFYILDLQSKTLRSNNGDTFTEDFEKNIKKINIINSIDEKTIYITPNKGEIIEIKLDKENNMISYKNNNITILKNSFLAYNRRLKNLECQNVEIIGNNVLCYNNNIDEISFPLVTKIGTSFMENNIILKSVYLPQVKEIGHRVFFKNKKLTELFLPNVIKIGSSFLDENNTLKKIILPNVQFIEDNFLFLNFDLEEIDIPKITEIGDRFLHRNLKLKEFKAPNLIKIGDDFLHSNVVIENLNCPNVFRIGKRFLYYNRELKILDLPNVIEVDSYFMYNNYNLKKINMPLVQIIAENFLYSNSELSSLNLPCVKIVGNDFLRNNSVLKILSVPTLEEVGDRFLNWNSALEQADLSSLKKHGINCLDYHPTINLSEIVSRNVKRR